MTRSSPWTYLEYQYLGQQLMVRDPQPRDSGTHRTSNGETVSFSSPHMPRPPKPVQPRDDGSARHLSTACFNARNDPNPRDPGNGRQLALRGPHPRDDGSNGCFSSRGNPPPAKPPVPRDPGTRKRREPKEVVPRDPGY